MSNRVTTSPSAGDSPAPAWLLTRFLQPGEALIWSRGTRMGPWREWALQRHPGLGIVLFLGFFAFPMTGAAVAALCGAAGGLGAFLGAPLAFGSMAAAIVTWALADKHVCYALSDRRLLVIKGAEKVEAFDVDLLRQLLTGGNAPAPAAATDHRVLDPSKVHALTHLMPDGVAEMCPLNELVRQFGQLQPIEKQ